MAESFLADDVLAAADQVEQVAAAYVDRVHDLVRRCGAGEPAATEIVGTTLLDLVDAVAGEPCPAGEAVAGWFAASRTLASRAPAAPAAPAGADDPPPAAGDLDAALRGLPTDELAAVLVHDRYELPVEVTAGVLGVPADEAARVVADGRLRLFAAVSGRPAAGLGGHRPNPVAEAGLLARYVDGTVPARRQVAVARHVAGCPECGDVVTAQDRARRLVAGLPVIEMAGDSRDAVLAHALGRAAQALPPSVDLVAFTAADPEPVPGRVAFVLSLLALAAVAGLLAGILSAH